jgi:DNA-directed RNA polymerase specialized sigma24 family protein
MAVSEDAFESLLSRARRQLRRALSEAQLPAKGDDHD